MPEPGRNQQFFHGTAREISDAVRPGAQVGFSVWKDMGASEGQPSSQHAFATTDEDEAWSFAHAAHSVGMSNHLISGWPEPDRARVYSVAPHPDMKLGIHHPEHPMHSGTSGELHEYIAPEFKVTDRHDIEPGRQGTFPSINWKDFSHPDISGDPNHPSPTEVAQGMRFLRGSKMGVRQRLLNKREVGVSDQPRRGVVTENQMDLFTGRTAGEHANEYDQDPDLSAHHGMRLEPFLFNTETDR
jgi:hypothetical protein